MKKLQIAFLFLFLFLVFICPAQNTSGRVDTSIQDSLDNTHYLLPFWDSTMNQAGPEGYIDTFTIDNYKFRIVHQDTMFDGVVEVNKNGEWYRTLEFENLGNHNNYDISNDLNGNGYNDLIFYWKWFGEIRFFDKTKKRFSDTINCTIGRDWSLLDTAKRIFYEVHEDRLLEPVISNLFIIKNFKRIDLFTLTLTFDRDDEDYIIKEEVLSSAKNDKKIENIKLTEKISVTDFDHRKFWNGRYKELLGYQ